MLVSALAIACTTDSWSSDDDAEQLIDDDGRIDWRTLVDNAEQNNGFRFNGFRFNGFRFNGFRFNGFRFNGFRFNGFRFNGEELTGVHMDGNLLSGEDSLGAIIKGANLGDSTIDVDFVDPEDANNTSSLEFELTNTETLANGLVISTVKHRQLPSGDWINSCENGAKAVHLKGDWDLTTGKRLTSDPSAVTFACLGAALGDCAAWGYAPGDQHGGATLDEYHEACTRLKRADYCGDGVHHTENGHLIDIYDDLSIQSPATIGLWEVEAMWGPDGALCANSPRILDYTMEVSSGSKEYIGCEIPACEDVNADGVIDFLDYPTAILANRTVPDWKTRDFTVHALYRNSDGLFYRSSKNGGNSFSDEVELTPSGTKYEHAPKVTIDDDDNIHVIYTTKSGLYLDELQHQVSTDGGQTFNPPQTITTQVASLECPDDEIGNDKEHRNEIVHDSAGNLHVFYTQELAGVRRIFYSKSSDIGSTWSPPIILDSATEDAWLRKVIVDSSGGIHLLYSELSSAAWTLYYRKSVDAGVSWPAPIQINDAGNQGFDSALILDSADNPHIAYQEILPCSQSQLMYRRSIDGGESFESAGSAVDMSTSCLKGHIESITIALDSNDLPHIAYENYNSDEHIFYVKSADGVTFTAPVSIDPDRPDNWNQHKVRLFMTPEDVPMITWQDMTDANGIFSGFITKSLDGGLSFEAPTRVNDTGGTWECVYEWAAYQAPDGNPYFIYSQFDIGLDTSLVYFKNSSSYGDEFGPTLRLSNRNWDKFPVLYFK